MNCSKNDTSSVLFNGAQVVGWPPIRSFRKNTMATNLPKNGDVTEGNSGRGGCLYVKVSVDGAPYLRKVDLKTCENYTVLSKALEKMFNYVTLGIHIFFSVLFHLKFVNEIISFVEHVHTSNLFLW